MPEDADPDRPLMLPAQRHPLFVRLLHFYVRRRLRKQFHAIELTGDTSRLRDASAYPLVYFCNHTSWWDGFLKVPLFQRFEQEYFVMMEEKNLRRFPFFRRAGAFGVDLDRPEGRKSSLLYAARLLRRAAGRRRVLVIYPHGRLVGPYEPFPDFQPGVEGLARLGRQGAAVPVGIAIRFDKFPDPVARIHIGEPLPFAAKPERSSLQDALDRAVQAARRADPVDCFLLDPKTRYRGKT